MDGAIVSIQAQVSETPVTSGYYFNVKFPTDGASANHFLTGMGSGLVDGDDYPASLNTPASGADVKLVSGTNVDSIRATSGTVATD